MLHLFDCISVWLLQFFGFRVFLEINCLNLASFFNVLVSVSFNSTVDSVFNFRAFKCDIFLISYDEH